MEQMTKQQIKNNATVPDKWWRGLAMIVFAAVAYFAIFLSFAIALFQFVCTLFTNKPNARLARFGQSLNTYVRNILGFICYETEEKPFPFSDWPSMH